LFDADTLTQIIAAVLIGCENLKNKTGFVLYNVKALSDVAILRQVGRTLLREVSRYWHYEDCQIL
jgi:hypothetical protein